MQHGDISRRHPHEPSPLTPTKLPLGATPSRSTSRTDLSRTVSASVDDGGGYPPARAVRRRSCSSRSVACRAGIRIRVAHRSARPIPRRRSPRPITRTSRIVDGARSRPRAVSTSMCAAPSETKSVHSWLDRARRNPATCTFYRRPATVAPCWPGQMPQACRLLSGHEGGDNESLTAHRSAGTRPRSAADVAIQRGLGLLSQRRARADPAAPRHPGAHTNCSIASRTLVSLVASRALVQPLRRRTQGSSSDDASQPSCNRALPAGRPWRSRVPVVIAHLGRGT